MKDVKQNEHICHLLKQVETMFDERSEKQTGGRNRRQRQ